MVSTGACANERVRVIRTTKDGNLQVQISPPTRIWKYIALADALETVIWNPAATETVVITDLIACSTAGGTCTFRNGTTGATILLLNLPANGSIAINFLTPIQLTARDLNFTGQASAATWYITVCGWAETLEP